MVHIYRPYLGYLLAIALLFVAVACQPSSEGGTGGVISTPNALSTLEDRGEIRDFALTDQNGRKVTLADLKGQVWVADFFFTSCQGACPKMNAQMLKLQHKLGKSGLKLLSITVDPAKDTPEHLKQYAQDFGADQSSWSFLTGEQAKIIELSVKGFKLSADENPSSHSQRLILLDRNSHIRGYYHNEEDKEMELLAQHAEQLLKN